MGKFTVSVFINRPLQDVFDFLSEPAIKHKWMPMLESAEWTSSAAPALPDPPMWLLIELVLQHILLIGLPLGILVQRNTR